MYTLYRVIDDKVDDNSIETFDKIQDALDTIRDKIAHSCHCHYLEIPPVDYEIDLAKQRLVINIARNQNYYIVPADLKSDLDNAEMRELLSALEHEQWSKWMRYLFEQGEYNGDGTWTMPEWALERWTRQVNTPYSELTEKEKDSDREQVDEMLNILSGEH